MALQGISTGTTPNDGTGDTLLVGAVKINENFEEIYNAIGDGTDLFQGDPNIDVGFITATGASFSGGVSIAGTLTYEDVTNIDSIGLVTARSGLDVTGVSTFNDSIGVGTEITLEASSGTVIVGSAVTITSEGIDATGIVTATTFDGSGASLTNIPNGALSFSNVSYGGISVTLGGSDDTPAFDLIDATNYPYSSLTGITTDILGDTSPQLGGDLDLNNNDITGTGGINISGVSTFQGDVRIIDDHQLRFGTSGSGILRIYTNGTNSFFKQTSGDLKYELANQFIVQKDTGDEPIAVFTADGSVDLYYDNSKKFETTTNGITVTGSIVKSGGTSGEFLKADGSVDSNTYLTSLGDAIQDADFTSNGFMKRTGAGTYTVDTNTYLTSETSHSDVLVDGDFTSNGFMKRTGAGTYTVDTNTYLTSSSGINATNINSGTVDVARIGTGTKNSTTYYRGDGTFATHNASSLSDFTEGTWTPVFEGAVTAGTYTYGTQLGTYIQIGNMITATCNLLNIATSSAGSGIIQITGLPSSSSASKGIHVGSCTLTKFNTAAGVMNVTCEIAAGTAVAVIRQCVDGGALDDLEVTDKVDDFADIRFTITYFT